MGLSLSKMVDLHGIVQSHDQVAMASILSWCLALSLYFVIQSELPSCQHSQQ